MSTTTRIHELADYLGLQVLIYRPDGMTRTVILDERGELFRCYGTREALAWLLGYAKALDRVGDRLRSFQAAEAEASRECTS